MMNNAGKKLKSKRGATLMLALLVFLVCVVLGSVVLTAATASAGRLAELADMEQRYYAVTSAAELLRSELCADTGVKVEWTRTTEGKTTSDYTVDDDGNIVIQEPSEYVETITYNTPSSEPAAAGFAGAIAEYFVLGAPAGTAATGTDAEKAAMWKAFTEGIGTAPTIPEMKLTVTPEGGAASEALTVNVAAVMNPDGSLTVSISNEKDKDHYEYMLKMTLAATIDRGVNRTESTTYSTGSGSTGASYYVETVTTEEKATDTVRWVVSSIQTVESKPSTSTPAP